MSLTKSRSDNHQGAKKRRVISDPSTNQWSVLTEPEPEDVIIRLHNAWLGRQEGCSRQGHDKRRSKVLLYGAHIQVVNLCNACYKAGKAEHRQLARKLLETERREG